MHALIVRACARHGTAGRRRVIGATRDDTAALHASRLLEADWPVAADAAGQIIISWLISTTPIYACFA